MNTTFDFKAVLESATAKIGQNGLQLNLSFSNVRAGQTDIVETLKLLQGEVISINIVNKQAVLDLDEKQQDLFDVEQMPDME